MTIYAYHAVQMFVNDLRKYKNQYNGKKCRGLTSNSCQVGGPTPYSLCVCPLYFAWIILSYLMPSHFIGILFLGPSILLHFLRGSTPLAPHVYIYPRIRTLMILNFERLIRIDNIT